MLENIPFQKEELTVKIHNPNNLPCVDYHKLSILQGDLKTLSEKNKAKLCKVYSSMAISFLRLYGSLVRICGYLMLHKDIKEVWLETYSSMGNRLVT